MYFCKPVFSITRQWHTILDPAGKSYNQFHLFLVSKLADIKLPRAQPKRATHSEVKGARRSNQTILGRYFHSRESHQTFPRMKLTHRRHLPQFVVVTCQTYRSGKAKLVTRRVMMHHPTSTFKVPMSQRHQSKPRVILGSFILTSASTKPARREANPAPSR